LERSNYHERQLSLPQGKPAGSSPAGPADAEGTRRCNHGRLCGALTVDGRDVGDILIGEWLAHRYVCSGHRCPRRPGWCWGFAWSMRRSSAVNGGQVERRDGGH
jgi:hypothetical protein